MMQSRCGWALVLALLGLPVLADEPAPMAGLVAKAETNPSSLAETGPKPNPIEPLPPEAIEASIRRGVDFLVTHQNKNGSWGSANSLRAIELYAPIPGAHLAFRAAVTSMCVMALCETASGEPAAEKAIDRGEGWLIANLPQVRRPSVDTLYNCWSHAYAIQALVKLLERKPEDIERAKKLRELIKQQIEMLVRYEYVGGGWSYYEFKAHTQKPSDVTFPFMTATVLVAFHEATRVGIEPPKDVVERAMDSIRRQRRPDYSILYGEHFRFRPGSSINQPGGALARVQSCNIAMRLWGDTSVTDKIVETWLDRLFARNMWLDIGRKRPMPHETWFKVSGYFFYFGYYYGARCMELLPEQERPHFQQHMAVILVRLQEKDGAWWDFPLYDYHKQYGTAYALMALQRTLPKRSTATAGKAAS